MSEAASGAHIGLGAGLLPPQAALLPPPAAMLPPSGALSSMYYHQGA